MTALSAIRSAMRAQADVQHAAQCASFFKTGRGEYGEGDRFLGLTMPQQRQIARAFRECNRAGVDALLHSRFHEERMVALLVLIEQFSRGGRVAQAAIARYYLRNAKRVNNWDLVDASAPRILGEYLLFLAGASPCPTPTSADARGRAKPFLPSRRVRRPRGVLLRLARSGCLWERRIAIVATMAFIAHGQYEDTLAVARMFLRDPHDLIHKATGWMLREVGKRDRAVLERFLQQHYRVMPHTMLRYAIERLPERRRRAYLHGRVS